MAEVRGGTGGADIRTESGSRQPEFEAVAVVPGRLALSQPKDVGEAEQHRDDRDPEGGHQAGLAADQDHEEQGQTRTDSPDEPPEQVPIESPGASGRIGSRIGIGEPKIRFHEKR